MRYNDHVRRGKTEYVAVGDAFMLVPQRLLDARIPWADFVLGEILYVPCNICGSFDFNTLASLLINSLEFFLVECPKCSLIWRNPLPGETFLSELYNADYFDVGARYPMLRDQVGVPDTDPKDRMFRDEISIKVVQSWVDLGILPRDQTGKPHKLLEIGGGRGYLQKAAQKYGWLTLGLEMSPYGIEEAHRSHLSVLSAPLNNLRGAPSEYNDCFDVIVFYDFLEHLSDPALGLRLINNMLKNTGTAIFRVPNTAGCPTLHLVDHIWHFSSQMLPALLAKEGFTVYHAHRSGRFIATQGNCIDNITVFAKKDATLNGQIYPDIELRSNPLDL